MQTFRVILSLEMLFYSLSGGSVSETYKKRRFSFGVMETNAGGPPIAILANARGQVPAVTGMVEQWLKIDCDAEPKNCLLGIGPQSAEHLPLDHGD